MHNNTSQNRFELEVNGHTAYADYKIENGILHIKYVFAPTELRGTGAAGNLMQQVMEHARAQNYKVIPICGYAASWIQRKKEFNDILAI